MKLIPRILYSDVYSIKMNPNDLGQIFIFLNLSVSGFWEGFPYDTTLLM